jgi:hypothetical protein
MLRYQKAERALRAGSYLLSRPNLKGQPCGNLARKTMKMYYLLDPSTILKDVNAVCSRGQQQHACKDLFKESPSLVRNWRVLWASLPRQTRQDQLLKSIATPGEFRFLGVRVCGLAFQHLTGISPGTLQTARENRDSGNVSYQSARQLGGWMAIARTNKPCRYLDATL